MRQMQQDEDILLETSDDASLYDRYGKTIFAYLRLHMSTREDAEDLTVDVFTTALEHDNLSALAPEDQLAWLRRVAHNRLIDSYRRSTRHPMVALDEVVETMFEDEDATPEALAVQSETYTQLHQIVAQLPEQQQQVLRLRYGDGLRFAEIATLLKKREEAVRKLLSRTLATLRTQYHRLAEEGGHTC